MSAGHRHTDAAPVSAVIRLIQREVGLRNFLVRPPIVSRRFLVPYGAGRSMDGGMTYADEGTPLRFKMGVEPDRYVNGHEGIEWWLMTRLGLKYWVGPGAKSAHWWATGYEHMLLKLDGWSDDDIVAYEDEWATLISGDEAARLSPETVPPDLYTGPYEPEMDSDEGEDGMDAKILPILLAARSRLMSVREVGLTA